MPPQSFNNPIKFQTFPELLSAILNVVIVISIPFIVFFLIYAGFLYVTAQGNPEQIRRASSALLWGIVGGVIIVGSVAILMIVESTVSAF